MKRDAVCITGIGAATPLGNDYRTIAGNLLAGKSGVRKVTTFNVNDHPSQIAASLVSIPCPTPSGPAARAGNAWDNWERLPRTEQLMLWCAFQALRDADWWDRRTQVRIGIVLGTAAEWLATWEADFQAGRDAICRPQAHVESVVHRTRRSLGLNGPAASLSAACASANYALAVARRWLELGWVDVCVAGGGDVGITPTILAGFANLRALSRRNHEPEGASRPFDTDRDGFVLGEGGVLFVLEKEATARQRSAHVYAKVAGFGATSDAFHMVIPSSDPEPAMNAVRRALADAAVDGSAVDYINAHATSTPVGDVAECRALENVFGSALAKIPVSSTKSMTGHLLTGAAAFEALACIVALESQALPPTINLDHPDPECHILHVAKQTQEKHVGLALSNSFGFGGSNTCLLLRAA
jgi:3-oxoacyl-[acyl-carrier-protein] synthase II